MGWATWIRGGSEIEPSLYAADFTRLGEQIDAIARGRLPRLPLRRRRRPFHSPGHDRTGRAALDRADDPCRRRGARLPPDGRRPGPPLRGVRRVRRRLGHLPRRGDRRSAGSRRRGARRSGLPSASPSIPATEPARAAAFAAAGGRRDDPLHEHRAGLLGTAVHARRVRADRRSSRALVEIPIQVDGGIGEANAAAVRDAGRRCSSPGNAVFADPDPADAYRRIAAAPA